MGSPKLKESLAANKMEMVTIKKRGKSYPDQFHPGDQNFMYIFNKQDGSEFVHFANEREESTLKTYSPGDSISVVVKDFMVDGKRQFYLQWGESDSSEMNAEPQLKTNTAMRTEVKKQEIQRVSEDDKWSQIALSKITHEFIKTAYAQGKPIMDAVADARSLVKAQYKLVDELSEELL